MSEGLSNIGRLVVLLLSMQGLIGCSSSGVRPVNGEPVTSVFDTFQRGDARLTCQSSCAFAWGLARPDSKELYDKQLWRDLVYRVAEVGFKSDQTYFYLGRAAEELGFYSAASVYYNLGRLSFKCAGAFNNCDGLVFPDEITAGLQRLPSGNPGVVSADPKALTSSGPMPVVHIDTPSISPRSAPSATAERRTVVSPELSKIDARGSSDKVAVLVSEAETGDGYALLNLGLHYGALSFTPSVNQSKYREISFALFILAKSKLPYGYTDADENFYSLFKTMTPVEAKRAKILAHIFKSRGIKNTIDEYVPF